MTSYAPLSAICRAAHLDIMGALHENGSTIVLLGPLEPDFWAHVTQSPEFKDSAPNPLDRWSKKAIGSIAQQIGAQAVFPSDGPPYPPFIGWALSSKRAWLSPAGLLVHDTAGLMLSFRGALRVPHQLELPPAGESPCLSCADKPCTTACPVDALQQDTYDVPSCMAFLKSSEREDSGDAQACRTRGCAARRACPVSQGYGRKPEQSAFHMRAFLGE